MASRVIKDPTHPDFPHGEERGYFRGCKRDCCRDAHIRAGKRRQYLQKQGRPVTVPAGPVREHVRALLAAGVTRGAILRAADHPMDLRSLCDLLGNGERPSTQERIAAPLARSLLAVSADDALACLPYVDKTESVRLIRCLQAQGWTLRYIASRLTPDGTAKAPGFLSDHACATVRAATARAVRALADEIGDRQGPSKRTAIIARRHGFYPLIAYDDDGVLHREWLADGSGGSRGTAHRETLSGDWLRCLSLSLAGKSLTDIAGITGLSERTVQRARERVGIRFMVSDEWGTTVPGPGQEPEVAAARRALAEWDGGGVDARAAWKALTRAVAAARAGDTTGCGVVDDEAA